MGTRDSPGYLGALDKRYGSFLCSFSLPISISSCEWEAAHWKYGHQPTAGYSWIPCIWTDSPPMLSIGCLNRKAIKHFIFFNINEETVASTLIFFNLQCENQQSNSFAKTSYKKESRNKLCKTRCLLKYIYFLTFDDEFYFYM